MRNLFPTGGIHLGKGTCVSRSGRKVGSGRGFGVSLGLTSLLGGRSAIHLCVGLLDRDRL